MNKERMLRVADLIDNAPEKQFHMGSWFGRYQKKRSDDSNELDWDWDSVSFSTDIIDLIVEKVNSESDAQELFSCGTTACIAGWAFTDMVINKVEFDHEDYIENISAEYLDLSKEESKALFYCSTNSVWYDVASWYGFEFDPDFTETWKLDNYSVAKVLRRIAEGDIDLSKFHSSSCDCDECYLNYSNDEEDVF